MRYLLLLALFTYCIPLLGQDHIIRIHPDDDYRTALELLDKKHMGASRAAFERFATHKLDDIKSEDADYFIAFTALSLFNLDGEYKVEAFAEKNPEHPKSAVANYELGSFYFREKDYAKAAEYLGKLDFSEISNKKGEDGRFKLAYALFARKQFEQALMHFNVLKRYTNEFTFASNYYAGYVEYRNKQFDLALTDFLKAEKGESYAPSIPFMVSSVYYKQGRTTDLINYAEKLLGKKDLRNSAEIKLMVGDAYYKNAEFTKAVNYFEEYNLDTKSGSSNPEILFRMAFAQYQMQENQKAIDNFKKAALSNDSLGQYASYYLGIVYLKEQNPMFALSAFEKAASMNFNAKISEEAAYNKGKVLFELAKYAEAITVLKDFKKKFPQSDYQSELDDMISEAYLNNSNFDEALSYMQALPNKSNKVKKAYQQVAFYKGVELFNNTRYFESVKMMERSLEYPVDAQWTIQAHFWIGEAYSIGKKYPEAINAYSSVFRNSDPDHEFYLKARYGIAYAYYNSQQYDRALTHFKEYVKSTQSRNNKLFYQDALIRLADCYYVNKFYSQAQENYELAIKNSHPDNDYAWFQKGVIQNLQNNPEAAKSSLSFVVKTFPDSRYLDDALFELAQVDFERGNYSAAVTGFTQLINQQRQSPFVPYALAKRAIAQFNLKNYSQSEADYKRVLTDYITHKTANNALLGLQEVLTIQNRSDEFQPYLTNYKNTNPENKGLSGIEFETAKNLFYSEKYELAISNLNDYLRNYPSTAPAFEAKYFLAESYNRTNQITPAIQFYKEVVADNKTGYVSRSVQRIAELEFKRGRYAEAILSYHKLLSLANTKREEYNAWSGLMESHFLLANYDSTAHFASIILEKGNVSANAQNKAYLYLGKAAFQKGNFEKAIDEFLNALNSARDEFGAEAQYHIALIYHQQKQYNQSLQSCYELNDKFGVYESWLGKSFLLIADNFVATNEIFQAKATLNSVISKSPDQQAVTQAKKKLAAIEAKEAGKKANTTDSLNRN